MSSKATTCSSAWTSVAGASPAAMRQKMQAMRAPSPRRRRLTRAPRPNYHPRLASARGKRSPSQRFAPVAPANRGSLDACHEIMSDSNTANPTAATATVDAPTTETPFDIRTAPIPSYASLVQARAAVFQTRRAAEAFARVIDALGSTGEEGRRKGLGAWMLGRYEHAVALLAPHGKDDVASFTRGHALMSLGRPREALAIFERLSSAYPKEPRPRGAKIEARVEAELLESGPEAALAKLEAELAAAPADFAASAEGEYALGRACELRRDHERALDHYAAARHADPTHRANLFHLAHLAERCGLDELALDAYRALATLLPIDKNVLFNLGVLYEDLGRDQDAAACYDVVVRNAPTDLRARLYLQDARSGMDMYYDEDLERKEDRLNQILRTPITDFELSVRARNCLNKMNIVTLGDLVKLSEQELLSYKNFGETSLNEIKEILNSKGLRLGMRHEEAVASIEAHVRPKATTEGADVLSKPISELDLSIRARRTVENLGCLTLGDVIQHTEPELLQMPNFGQTSLQELKRKLAEHGLALGEKSPKPT
jgi:DNA-directed RNA polymerase subunit alpha